MSPAGQVWVQRTTAAEVTDVVYDVFDSSGKRIDRVKLPDGSRVVGFGSWSVLVRSTAPRAAASWASTGGSDDA